MKKLKSLHKRRISKTKKPRTYVRNSRKKPKKKKIYIYPERDCEFIDKNGTKCTKKAVGKDMFCKKHGGNPVIKENLIPDNMIPFDILRITKYKPDFHPFQFIKLSKIGMSDTEIAAEFEIGIETLRGWAERYESFNNAFEIGRALHEAWWLEVGKRGLRDRAFNTTLYKFLTGNKLGYSEKIENKNVNTHNFGVLMIPGVKTKDEWEETETIDI